MIYGSDSLEPVLACRCMLKFVEIYFENPVKKLWDWRVRMIYLKLGIGDGTGNNHACWDDYSGLGV